MDTLPDQHKKFRNHCDNIIGFINDQRHGLEHRDKKLLGQLLQDVVQSLILADNADILMEAIMALEEIFPELGVK